MPCNAHPVSRSRRGIHVSLLLMQRDPEAILNGTIQSITPASQANGALILRHEIGHSIIQVGEEHHGGFAYFGVNAIHDPKDVTWAHWLTHSDHPRIERSMIRMQACLWMLPDVEKPWSLRSRRLGRTLPAWSSSHCRGYLAG